jgi:outer membrane protein insertion porin family
MRFRPASVILLAVFLLAVLALPAAAVVVKEVRVETTGHGLADKESVLAYTSVKVGDEFNRMAVNRDVKALQKSSRYSSVSADVDSVLGGVVVTYTVDAKLRIGKMEITGADYLGNKKVRDLLEMGVSDPVDDASLAVHAQKVRDTYNKKYFPYAKLTWTIEPMKEPGMAFVRIAVKEGKRANVKSIRFSGNSKIRSYVLRKTMKQRTVNWLSWITGAGQYNPDDLESDVESLRKAYLDQGYLDVVVKPPEITMVNPKKIRIAIPIEEGKQYHIGKIELSGTSLFPTSQVSSVIKVKPGNVASVEQIDTSGQEVKDFYGSRGYIRSVVDYNMDVNIEKSTADVYYKVTEGHLAYIRNIKIRGNSVTKDKVIRRELDVYPGQIYNEVKVRRSEKRLRNLGFFSYVNSVPESTAVSDQYDLALDVEEQKTGQFMIGAGFSSVDDIIGFVELSQGNFDLGGWPRFSGGGQKLRMRAQFGTSRKDYEISFVEPWFLNRRLSLGVDLFEHDARFLSTDYNQLNIGGNISLGRPLGTYNRVNLIYGLESFKVYDVATNASQLIRQEEGTRTKSSMTLELVHDSRNSVFIPSRGNRSSAAPMVAGGLLGADTDIYGFTTRSSQYFPLWFDHVFNLRGYAAAVDNYGDSEWVPIFDRLFLGGPRTVRGFRFRDVGPKVLKSNAATNSTSTEAYGGQSALCGTAEYTLPVAEKVRLAAFYDVGIVWADIFEKSDNPSIVGGDGEVNSAIGVGVRFDFPGFPIQLDYAWPLETDRYNNRPSGRFSFWIGYTY